MQMQQASLTIIGHTFRTGDTVVTPAGLGEILSIEPLSDTELLVWLGGEEFRWFSVLEVEFA